MIYVAPMRSLVQEMVANFSKVCMFGVNVYGMICLISMQKVALGREIYMHDTC